MKEQFRFMRLKEVLLLTGLGKTTLYKKIAASEFPWQTAVSKRSIRWGSAAVEQRMNERLESVAVDTAPLPANRPQRDPCCATNGGGA